MSFQINNLVIHEIDKSQPIKGGKVASAKINPATTLTPTSSGDEWHKLLETVLNKTNNDRRLRRGNFINTTGFKDGYDIYQAQNKSFLNLSLETTNNLAIEMNNEPMSTGGFILFAEINQNSANYFYCIMFKQKMGEDLTFDKQLGRYILEDVIFLDLEKMHQGFCLELDDYQAAKNKNTLFVNEEKPYLYFINMQNNINANTATYFINTFKCRVVENSAKSMRILLDKTVNTFKQEPKLAPYADDIKKQVTTLYATCESTKSDIELSIVETLMEVYKTKAGISDPDFKLIVDGWFSDLVHSPSNPISASFPVNTDALDRMRMYKETVDGFTISGDKETLLKSQSNDAVFYDHSNKKIIISLIQPIS